MTIQVKNFRFRETFSRPYFPFNKILKDFNRSVFIYCALLREYVGYGDKNCENADLS